MTKNALTVDEKKCLQMWFRQALAKVEAEEVAYRMLKEHAQDSGLQVGHRVHAGRRRSVRVLRTPHLKQLV